MHSVRQADRGDKRHFIFTIYINNNKLEISNMYTLYATSEKMMTITSLIYLGKFFYVLHFKKPQWNKLVDH